MLITYDPEADAVYVSLRSLKRSEVVDRTVHLDERRNVDYAADGELLGVEFLWVSDGIDLSGVPHADEIRSLLSRFATVLPV